MTLDSAEQLLDSFLRSVTTPLGFDAIERLIYSRVENEATAVLAFPCRIDPRGPACFGCSVWLRFESLERFLRGDAAKLSIPTVSMPLHLLRENKSFTEWQFRTSEDLEQLRDTVTRELTNIALPFVEKHSRLTEIHRKLESATPADWFALGPEGRLTALAAIQFIQDDKPGALKTLDDALLERKAALPKKRLPIEMLRKRLAQTV
jgi:hypothetical protein